MNPIFEKILKDFKRANKAAKEKMAERYGFKKIDEFETFLNTGLVSTPIEVGKAKKASKKTKVVERIIVHNVHILDASGSMGEPYKAPKITAALQGINQEVEDMKKDNSTEVTQTIVHFSDPFDIQTFCYKKPLGEMGKFSAKVRNSTALLETIGQTLTKLKNEANGKDKYLIKIFTDGIENSTPLNSEWHNPKNVSTLIKACEAVGFTVTFVGTDDDVARVIQLLAIDKSNTVSHKNTAESILATYALSSAATVKYRGAAARGEDVTFDFFTKETGTL